MSISLDARRLKYASYYDWYYGKLDSLYAVPANQVNGLSIMTPEELPVRFNYFSAASRFFADAALGDSPQDDPYYRIIERCARDWSVTGEFCLAVVDGQLHTYRPDYVFPLAETADFSRLRGFLFVTPLLDSVNQLSGKARVIHYDLSTGRAMETERDYAYGVLEEPRMEGTPIAMTNVIWGNTEDGTYGDLEGLVRELHVRMAFMSSAHNSTDLTLLQLAADSIPGFEGAGDVAPGKVSPKAKSGLGILVQPPLSGESPGQYIERSGDGMRESLEYARFLMGLISVTSGVPDYVYGVSLNQSPSEVERLLFAGQARIGRFRHALTTALASLGIEAQFPSEPFATRKGRVDNLLALLERGVLTTSEVRGALGYSTDGPAMEAIGRRMIRGE